MTDRAERDTLVIANMGGVIPRTLSINGVEAQVTAWHAGNALSEKEMLADFVRKLSYGEIDDPQAAAEALMDAMGWA